MTPATPSATTTSAEERLIEGERRQAPGSAVTECKGSKVEAENQGSSIAIHPRWNALKDARLAQQGWRRAYSGTICGWGLILTEGHRVALHHGEDLVFFAPEGADMESQVKLDEASHAAAEAEAKKWARRHPVRVKRSKITRPALLEIDQWLNCSSSERERRGKATPKPCDLDWRAYELLRSESGKVGPGVRVLEHPRVKLPVGLCQASREMQWAYGWLSTRGYIGVEVIGEATLLKTLETPPRPEDAKRDGN